MADSHRLDVLDGMRGIAALSVVLYHYLARWAEPAHDRTLYPHGNLSDALPGLTDYGRFGVFLFFMISGFVIMMTLERSTGIADFALRRLLRLWPAMLVCATLSSFIVNRSGMGAYYGMDLWEVDFLEYLSSIFFLPPDLTYRYLDMPEQGHWVEGVYWTLWAEIRFYALAAVIYFLAPKRGFSWFWLLAQCAAMMVLLSDPAPGQMFYPVLLLQPATLPWFTLGICGYRYWRGTMALPVWLALVPALISLLADQGMSGRALFLWIAVCGLFLLFLLRSPLLAPLAWRPFVVLGMVSYPLYLFHEMPGMAGFMLAERMDVPAHLSVPLMVAIVVAAAMGVHYLVERPLKRRLSPHLSVLARETEARFPMLRFRNANPVA